MVRYLDEDITVQYHDVYIMVQFYGVYHGELWVQNLPVVDKYSLIEVSVIGAFRILQG